MTKILSFLTCTGWFLPSLRELSDIYDNKELVSSSRVKAGGTAIANGGYWSSTERTGTDSGGGYTAFTFYMGSNGTAGYSAYQFNNYVSCAISY
ncbi:MAG: hypothetical protein E7020_06045 [Alphaproteobacteria bacterium]|nr:hypothetical protein [Alphaproteobacteria bacterium]